MAKAKVVDQSGEKVVGNIHEALLQYAVPLSSLNLDPDNARKHPPESIQAIKRSLKQFGQDQPVVVQREGMRIRKGNGRYVAARELGWSHIAAVVVDESDALAAARAIADNRSAEFAAWDLPRLYRIWNNVNDRDPKLGVAMGFSKTTLKTFVEGRGMSIDELEQSRSAAGNESPDAVPLPMDEPEAKRGDIWVLGNHRLMCGDSSSPDDLDRLLDGAVIHLINTDPPYNVALQSRSNSAADAGQWNTDAGATRGGTTRAKDRPLANDSMSEEEYQKKLRSWFTNMARVAMPGASFYVWGGFSNCENYPPAMKECGLYFSQAIIWVKDHPVLSRKDWNTNHEWCFYGWIEGGPHRFFGGANAQDVWRLSRSASGSVALGRGVRLKMKDGSRIEVRPPGIDLTIRDVAVDGIEATIFGADQASDVWSVKKVNSQAMVHLTEKPVELAAKAIVCSSLEGENVLDLFGGSGSTLIAAEQNGRRAHLMELDPAYAEVIVKRWQEFTGKKAKLIRKKK